MTIADIARPVESRRTLVPYIDAFDPPAFVQPERVRILGAEILPRLLEALSQKRLCPLVGHDLNIVSRVCERSGGEMRLIQLSDPRYHPNASPADSNILVVQHDGEIVGCVASRLIWCEHSLAEEMESGRFWVSDPTTMWSPELRCFTTAISAVTIRACFVVYSGSVYLAPEFRGGNTLAAMIRLHNLWLICHWRWSWLVGIVRGDLLHHHAFDIYGSHSIQQALWRDREGDGEMTRYHLGFTDRAVAMDAWLRPEMGDLSRPLGLPPAAILPYEAPLPKWKRRNEEAIQAATASE